MSPARVHAAACLVALTLAGARELWAAPLPGWLSVGDLGRAPADTIPAIDGDRLQQWRKEKHGHVERLRRQDIVLSPDGLVEERSVIARQFLDEQGVRSGGNLSIYAHTVTDRVRIEQAYVLTPSGQRRPFDPRLIQIRADSGRDMFSDLVEVVLPFSSLEIGSTVVVVSRRTHDTRRWPLPWSHVVYTQEGVPLERVELSMRWPKAARPPVWKTDDPQLTCQEEPQRLTCRRSGVPAVADDPQVVSWPDVMPHLVLTTEPRWESLVALERKLLAPPAASASVEAFARKLVQGARDDEQRVQRLFRFVADDIRYLGLEHGRGAVVPRPPQLTLERRFGDCKDKVALLLSLVRAVGLDGYPVLAATSRRDPEKLLLPSWKYFDHVIACVYRRDGVLRCMDPTDPDLPAGVVSLGVRKAVVLPLQDGGVPDTLPEGDPIGPAGWVIELVTENKVLCDGTVEERVSRSYWGAGAGEMRGRLRGQNAADRQRWIENIYSGVMGEKVKPTIELEGLEDATAPLTFSTRARWPGQSAAADWSDYTERDSWLVDIGNDFRITNRHHPFVLGGLQLTSKVTFDVCAEVVPRFLGPTLELDSEFGKLERSYERKGQVVTAQTTLTLKPQVVQPASFADYNKFLDTALGQTRLWFSLIKARVPVRSP